MTESIECDFVNRHLDGIELVDARPEIVWVPSERDLQQRQEAVHAGQQTLGTAGNNCSSSSSEICASCCRGSESFRWLLRVR